MALERLGFGDWQPPGRFDPATRVWFVEADVANRFPDSGVDIFADVDQHSFWFAHRNRMIARVLDIHARSGTFVEVGSGSGAVGASFERPERPVACVEPIAGGAIAAAERGVTTSFCGDLESLCLPDETVPVIGAFDVIEHLDSPALLLLECRRIIRTDGLLVLTVPAHQFLWSDLDEWNGHTRRYSVPAVRELLTETGFNPCWLSHFFAPLVLPAFVSRVVPSHIRGPRTPEEIEEKLRANLAPRSSWVDRALRWIHRPELATVDRVRLPFGTSVIAVARPRRDGRTPLV